jgi:aminopeptidase N
VKTLRYPGAAFALAAVCLVCARPLVSARAADAPRLLVHHELSVRLDSDTRVLEATDTITVPATHRLAFLLAAPLRPNQVLLDGNPAIPVTEVQGDSMRYELPVAMPRTHTLVVRYRGTLPPLTAHTEREVLRALPAMIGPEGGYLPAGSAWYPALDTEVCTYRVHLDVAADQRGVMPGHLVSEATRNGRYLATFEFLQPAEGLTMMLGPYAVREQLLPQDHGDPIRLRTYFHPAIADLAGEYLSAAAHFLDLYSGWIGSYPYRAFSVVSSPLPTGFGMPGLTYLGVDVLRLPFIKTSSLGHEILHNWWGNGVRVAWEQGNWSEALTTFMGDYTFKEQEGAPAARDMRWAWLRDFAAIPPGQDRPVRAFTARVHDTSQIVGYDKGAFLFLMLRDEIGREAFDRGMRRFWQEWQFRPAGWDDLRRVLEEAAGRDLSTFFGQWLSRRGAPKIWIEAAHAERTPGGYRLHLALAQGGPGYALRLPVAITTDAGHEERIALLAGLRQEVVMDLPSRPRALVLDPEFRIFRQLAPSEVPPILRDVTLDPATETLILGTDEPMQQAARQLARRFLDREPRLARESGADAPLLVLGTAGEVDAWAGRAGVAPRPGPLHRGTAQVWAARTQTGKPVVVVSAADSQALAALLRPLPHYGRQSYLVFEGANAIERGVWPAHSPEWRFE